MSIENETQMNPGTEEIQNNTGQECTVTTDSSCCSETMENAKNAQIHTGEYVTIRCPEGVAWRKIKAPKTTTFVMYTHGGLNTVGNLYDCAGNLIAYSDNVGESNDFSIKTTLEKDCTYYLRMSLADNCCGTFWLMVGFPIESITLSRQLMPLKKGDCYALLATISPSVAGSHTIVWSSDNPNIAVVHQTGGLVLGREYGIATISAKAKEDPSICATCIVHVGESSVAISIDPYEKYMVVGEQQQLSATLYAPDESNKTLQWSSCCPCVAEVDDNGVVTAKNEGAAQILITHLDSGYTDYCYIEVYNNGIDTDKRPKAFVKKTYDGYYEIEFSDQKRWKCINHDLIYDYDSTRDQNLVERLDENLYEQTGELKQYSDDEIKVIYTIDPLGFSAYVKEYASQLFRNGTDVEDSLKRSLDYKDRIFRLLFGRCPKYYARDLARVWYVTTDKSELNDVLSESEFLFGHHPIYDLVTGHDILSVIIDIILVAAGWGGGGSGGVKTAITIAKLYILGCSVAKDVLNADFKSFVSDVASGLTNVEDDGLIPQPIDISSKYGFQNFTLGWAFDLISIANSLQTLANTFKSGPHFYKEFFTYCEEDLNYNIIIQTSGFKSVALSMVNKIIE